MTFHEINAELKTIRDELSTDIPNNRKLELLAERYILEGMFKQNYVYREEEICNSCENNDVCMVKSMHKEKLILECNYYE